MEGYAVALVVGDGGGALQAGEGDETVLLEQGATQACAGGEDVDNEVGAVDDAGGAFGRSCVVGTVVGVDMEIDGITCLEGVKLTGLDIESEAVVVEEAVGDVGALLDLAYHDAAADGVDATGWNEEDIAGMDLMTSKDIDDGAILNAMCIVVLRDLLLETNEHGGTGVSLHDVPHLSLAKGAVALVGQLVVGMYLDGEVLCGIDKLDEEGQLRTITFHDMIAEEDGSILIDEAVDAATCEASVANV